MQDNEALTVLRTMRDRAIDEAAGAKVRLDRLNAEWEAGDHGADTKAAIETASDRVTRRYLEAEALSLAVANFNAPPVPVTDKIARIPLVEIRRGDAVSNVQIKFFNKADQQIAAIDARPEEVQELAVRILAQTTYSFADTAKALEDANFRLDSLDK